MTKKKTARKPGCKRKAAAVDSDDESDDETSPAKKPKSTTKSGKRAAVARPRPSPKTPKKSELREKATPLSTIRKREVRYRWQ